MKNKLSFVVFLFLLISISMNSVKADPAPSADFITIYTTVFHPGPQLLANGSTIEWDFNADGAIDSSGVNGSYVFPGPGIYNVKLTSTNNLGVKTFSTKTITIAESLVPSALPIPSNWLNTAWKARTKLTVPAAKVSEDLTDFPIYVKLADLGDSFFTKVSQGCGDIRVTDSTGMTELPREIVSCDSATKTGELHFKASSLKAASNNDFYIYYANPTATNYENTATYGRNKVWTSFRLIYHLNDNPAATAPQVTDATGNSLTGTTQNAMNANDLIDTVVGKGYDMDGIDDYITILDPIDPTEYTISVIAKISAGNSGSFVVRNSGNTPGSGSFSHNLRYINSKLEHYYFDGAPKTIQSTDSLIPGSWYYISASAKNSGNAYLYVNGNKQTQSQTVSTLWTGGDTYNLLGYSAATSVMNGDVAEFRISNAQKSDGWIKAEYTNLITPINFYTISETNLIGDTSTPSTPTIPSNWMNSAWKARVKLTVPSAKVAEDLTDFPVYIKLADLGTDFFAKLNANCGDIRVTDSTGMTELAREIVSCNPTAKTGELHFKASSLKAASSNDFYIYYANPAAVNYENTATYGRNKVWTSDFELVAHFEENPSTTLFVNSTGGVSGAYTNLGGLGTTAGSLGNSLDCSITSPIGYVDLDSFSANPHRNFAFSAFINFSAITTPQVFFEYASPGGLNTRRVGAMFNAGKINWNHNNYDGNVDLTTTINVGTWYHFSVNSLEEDSTHAKVSTWLDGVANSFKTGYDSDNMTANLGVICANRLFGESYNGKIDELRFYKNFKSTAWMVAEDSNLRSPSAFYTIGAKESL